MKQEKTASNVGNWFVIILCALFLLLCICLPMASGVVELFQPEPVRPLPTLTNIEIEKTRISRSIIAFELQSTEIQKTSGYLTNQFSSIYNPTKIVDTNNQGCPYGCEEPKLECVIKGNISFTTSEKIFHVPGQEYYSDTKIDPEYGERWFCTEGEAIANGWRKAYR